MSYWCRLAKETKMKQLNDSGCESSPVTLIQSHILSKCPWERNQTINRSLTVKLESKLNAFDWQWWRVWCRYSWVHAALEFWVRFRVYGPLRAPHVPGPLGDDRELQAQWWSASFWQLNTSSTKTQHYWHHLHRDDLSNVSQSRAPRLNVQSGV